MSSFPSNCVLLGTGLWGGLSLHHVILFLTFAALTSEAAPAHTGSREVKTAQTVEEWQGLGDVLRKGAVQSEQSGDMRSEGVFVDKFTRFRENTQLKAWHRSSLNLTHLTLFFTFAVLSYLLLRCYSSLHKQKYSSSLRLLAEKNDGFPPCEGDDASNNDVESDAAGPSDDDDDPLLAKQEATELAEKILQETIRALKVGENGYEIRLQGVKCSITWYDDQPLGEEDLQTILSILNEEETKSDLAGKIQFANPIDKMAIFNVHLDPSSMTINKLLKFFIDLDPYSGRRVRVELPISSDDSDEDDFH